ncbi:hypothetical protein FNV43_RR02612 [Rhamnella rubrinervis]|uniref:Uncharacterized protein n=1 Tax=Rhamnella rubrinervis TaxID=2594499 RepID=A0A8K0HTQ7_9ROSA|nr:hypothetical protein FNV43_RR02612 [Rhamnella rubrinervis]
MAPLKRLRKAKRQHGWLLAKKRPVRLRNLMHSGFHEELFRVGDIAHLRHIQLQSGTQSYLIKAEGIDQFEASIFGDFTG